MSTSGPGTPTDDLGVQWTIRGLIAGHKQASLGAAVVIALLVAMVVVPALGAKGGVVSDSTSCTQWGSANVDQQDAYARLYISEHGSVSPRWGQPPASVINAINAGCTQAFGENVSDSATVLQAVSRTF
ncbi:MAG TPA: hypothetical protein VGH24_02125 [Solirubrobacteraceae bacterium]